MNPLFSKSSLMVLESLSFTQTLYAFDFDGTLSKIVPSPEKAKLSRTTAKLLEQLSQMASVAIVSGRSVSDLKQRLPFELEYLVGNHGLEGWGCDKKCLERARKICSGWKTSLDDEDLGDGIEIEDKDYSLAVHYRASPQKTKAKRLILKCAASLKPVPEIIPGKSVVNFLPERSAHKGTAIQTLISKLGMKQALYIGDDDTDEDVFRLNDSRIMKVRVGSKKHSQAKYYITRQKDINEVLKTLVRFQSSSKGYGKGKGCGQSDF